MKALFKYAMLFASVAAMTGLTACGDDNDDNTPDIPVYPENPSGTALWVGSLSNPIDMQNAKFLQVKQMNYGGLGTIEFTESGYYVMIPAEYYLRNGRSNAPREAAAMHSAATRDEDSFRYGSYTVNTDGSYNLSGYGTAIYLNGTLTLAPNNGVVENYDVVEVTPLLASNDLNNRLCRTWEVTGAKQELLTEDGKLLNSRTYSGASLRDEYERYIVMTHAGTYFGIDWDGDLDDYSSWSWDNETNQVFKLMHKDDGYTQTSYIKTYFNDSEVTFYFEEKEYDDDYNQTVIEREYIYATAR